MTSSAAHDRGGEPEDDDETRRRVPREEAVMIQYRSSTSTSRARGPPPSSIACWCLPQCVLHCSRPHSRRHPSRAASRHGAKFQTWTGASSKVATELQVWQRGACPARLLRSVVLKSNRRLASGMQRRAAIGESWRLSDCGRRSSRRPRKLLNRLLRRCLTLSGQPTWLASKRMIRG